MEKEKFKLIEDLGGGGFARTYKAQVLDENLCKDWGKAVVIKIPHNKIKEKNLLKEAFKYERLRDIESQHIVSYLDIELYRDQYVLVISYVEATSLEEVLERKKKLDIEEAVSIIEQCCEALVAAEKFNILHRDIDPSNILICKKDGQVKLTDFGISEILRNPEQSCVVTGKCQYMAPEVFEGKVSFASDVYALGVTFYQIITGVLPFQEPNREALINKIINTDPVEPLKLNKEIDKELNQIILKAIARDKGQRYKNAKELLDDIRKYKESKTQAHTIKSKIQNAWQQFNNTNTGACKNILLELNKQFEDEPLTYLALGEFYNRMEQYDKAIEVFTKGIKKIVNNAILYKDLSISYMKKGDFSEAVAALEKAAALGLDKKDKDQALKLLSALSAKSKSKQRQIIMLTAIHGPYKGHKFVFSAKVPIIIGREQESNVSLIDDQFVSRKHGSISYEDGHFVLKDSNSKNGTFIDGKKVSQVVLEDEDIITIGSTHLKVFIRTVEGYLINRNK